ncbi:MAG: class I SAM-dependent methyltransferase [Anaerolineales bacterium]
MLWPLIGLAVVILLVMWELWVCEGAHLGRRFVVMMYNVAANRYDTIKDFDAAWERQFLGEPLAQALGSLPGPRVLDVGAGTGRTARALLPLLRGEALLAAVEPSRRMQIVGAGHVADPRAAWVRAWAHPLPFADDTFDLVVTLEMLEFTPAPRRALQEMVRVLRPGGWLLTTNRVGAQAPWILGRTFPRAAFPHVLERLGLEGIETHAWQVEYDLHWARKPDPVTAPVRS